MEATLFVMQPEPWLRGPVAGVHPAIQPLLFSFTQIREDLHRHTAGLANEDVWRPAPGGGTLGFHLRHIAGSVERLTSYLFGEQLSEAQLSQLKAESEPRGTTLEELLAVVDSALAASENRVKALDAAALEEPRYVGRKMLPTTVFGLLVHIAEHSQRHVGQAITITKSLRAARS
jgi:uncharacterized damage-inducible protein DinB